LADEQVADMKPVSVLMQMFYAEPHDETVIPALRSLAGWMPESWIKEKVID
jgi:hypothetical protein